MNILPKQIIENISIKNVKENFGHDLGGFFCDIYFRKKKVGYLNNDGWGGCPDVNTYGYEEKDKALMNSLKDFLTQENFAQFIADDYNKSETFKKDWKAEDFGFEEQVEFLCERLNFIRSIVRNNKRKQSYLETQKDMVIN